MAGALSGAFLEAVATFEWRDSAFPNVVAADSQGISKRFTIGTGANSCNKVIAKTYSIAASGNQVLDLNGTLTDPAGNAVSMTKLKGILVVNSSEASSTGITFGPGASNPVTTVFAATNDLLNILNGGAVVIVAPTTNGYALTAGSADSFTITNTDGSNAATVYVVFFGE